LVADPLQRFRRRPRKFAFADQIATHVADQIDVSDQHRTLLDARLAHGAGPKRFIMDCSMHILAAYRHQISQIDHDRFRRKRFAGGGRRTRVFAPTAFHAGIKTEQRQQGFQIPS